MEINRSDFSEGSSDEIAPSGDKRSYFTSGILAFIIAFFTPVIFLTLLFFIKYKEDFFEKSVPADILAKVTFYTMVSMTSFVIPVSLFAMSAYYFRSLFRVQDANIRQSMRKAIFPGLVLGVACFFWNGYLIPASNLHQLPLLYDIRMKKADQPMEHVDPEVFKNKSITINYSEVRALKDSVEKRIAEIKRETAYSILVFADDEEIEEAINDTIAQQMGMTRADFTDTLIANDGHVKDENHQFRSYIHPYLEGGYRALLDVRKKEAIFKIFKYRMIGYAFISMMFFLGGILIGNLTSRNKYLIAIVLCVTIILWPALYFLKGFLESLASKGTISPIVNELSFQLFLLVIVFMLYKFASRNRIKKPERTIDEFSDAN